ncbi:MAG: glycoside hydrolase family 15 protein [Bacteroidetes bacterium]|jgi:GH15 family glucan-1,4-alpha-glucosidase|nr:glycoside hydrolase family 15 protein [Bacteroidota bacterium]
MSYLPIEDHGLIGNMRTAALVGMNGAIDWLCLPHFDAPSVFASLLDDEQGGSFQITPEAEGVTFRQVYWPETNVLLTRFLADGGVAEIIDYMPVGLREGDRGYGQLIRRVEIVRGAMPLRVRCQPAFNYARDPHETTLADDGAVFRSPDLSLGLSATVPLQRCDGPLGPGAAATLDLDVGDRAIFALHMLDEDEACRPRFALGEEDDLFQNTLDYWRRWISQCTYQGRWREQVHRSALALKLMTFEPTGAIVASPTCSLPEGIGGERNWDYRYTWIRDAAFTVYGLIRVGFTDEAAAFVEWMNDRCRDRNADGSLNIVYGIDGRKDLHEETLDHLDGYRGSRPVRIGNGAYDQLQLDIYGELMDAVYLYNKYRSPIAADFWGQLSDLVDWVCDNWERRDEGIWEVRGPQQHFTYSKLMCWVAVDRALRLAEKRSFPADRQRWLACRDAIYRDILDRGWDADRQAFVQHYDTDALDASNLIMPLVFFMSPNDPRMIQTLEATCQRPDEGGLLSDSLVYRYNTTHVDDGIEGDEGSFNMCTFWLVEALTRAGRTDGDRLNQARLMFEKMLGYANHLGLYAEETGPCGEALGNFPQAFTHLSLISAAFNLNRTLDGQRYGQIGE